MQPSKRLNAFGETIGQDALQILSVDRCAGMLVEVNNGVTRDFRIAHALDMNSKEYTAFAFLRQTDATLKGTMSSSGQMTACVDYEFSESMKAFAKSYYADSKTAHLNLGGTFAATDDLVTSFKFAKRFSGKDNSYVFGADFVYRASESWTMGAQCLWDKTVAKASTLVPASAFALQYEHPLATGTFTATSRGKLVAQCARRVCHYNKPGEDNVGLATALTFDTKTGKSDVQIGAEFLLPNSKAKMSACITGSGKFNVCIRERLADWMMLRLTSQVDHSDNSFLFGIGMQIGPSAPKDTKTFQPLRVDRWDKEPVVKLPTCLSDWETR
jgi:hypothetical protein